MNYTSTTFQVNNKYISMPGENLPCPEVVPRLSRRNLMDNLWIPYGQPMDTLWIIPNYTSEIVTKKYQHEMPGSTELPAHKPCFPTWR